MARIAVIGPGAVGTTVAAWLAYAGHTIAVCARSPLSSLRVEHPDGLLESAPALWLSPAQAAAVDWVLVATKAYDSEAAAAWFPALLAAQTRIAILQNGVDHLERFAPFAEARRLLPVVVDIPVERLGPGHVRQRRAGSLVVPAGPDGEAFAALFAQTSLAAAVTDDFTTALWAKLCRNSAGAVGAIVGSAAGGLAADPDLAVFLHAIVSEAAAVGRAAGARLPDTLADEIVAAHRAPGPGTVHSLLADRLAGRRMEIDARNGAIVRHGARLGVATPANALAVALLRACAGASP